MDTSLQPRACTERRVLSAATRCFSGRSKGPLPLQTASQLTSGSADGSGGSDQAPAPEPRAAPRNGGSKTRRPRSGRTPASCQVEGCGVSLEGGKPFYRLQRICGERGGKHPEHPETS